jgi:DnaJ-domain-containing protein 1
MRIPFWIWIVLGLTAISWILPDPIPGEEFLLPAIAIGGILLRAIFMMNQKNQYKQQYQQYKKQHGQGGGTAGGGSQTGSQSSGSFYSRFGSWGAGFQQPQPPPSTKDPYELLGIDRGASMEKIKKAYRDKLKKFHPDVVENLKLGPEYREMFEEKTREIQKAFEQLGGK